MKKSLISLVAAAALVGGTMAVATPSFAGTVNAGGGTNVSMYGFIRTYTQWDKKAGTSSLVADNSKATSPKVLAKQHPKVAWSGFGAFPTRLGLKFNSGNGVSGKLETDFEGVGNTALRLRHAYVKQDLGGGAWVLVGQTWPIGFVGATFTGSLNDSTQPGILGAAVRRGQVQLGSTFAFGGGSLTAVGELEDFSNYVNSGVARKTFPGFGGKLVAKIKTGFGAPATVYGLVFGQGLKITSPVAGGGVISKTPYAFAAGAAIPLSMVTLKTNFDYAKGATQFIGWAVGGPNSYYANGTTVKATTATAWNLEADIAPTKDLGFALGYFTAKFKKAAVKTAGTIRKTATIFAQVNYKTSKATQVAFEWDHLKTQRYDGTTYYSDKGNQEFLTYQYNF